MLQTYYIALIKSIETWHFRLSQLQPNSTKRKILLSSPLSVPPARAQKRAIDPRSRARKVATFKLSFALYNNSHLILGNEIREKVFK